MHIINLTKQQNNLFCAKCMVIINKSIILYNQYSNREYLIKEHLSKSIRNIFIHKIACCCSKGELEGKNTAT